MGLRELSDGLADAVAAVAGSVVTVRARRARVSGLVWNEELVVTVAHPLGRADRVDVVLPGGEVRGAEVVGRDAGTDLALLRVSGGGLVAAAWADGLPRVGELVVAVGARRGRARAALGLVADVAGPWQTPMGAEVAAWLDVDGALPEGGSGGPLVDADGRVIGLSTAGLTARGAVLPKATQEAVVSRLLARGTAAPGYLGVGFTPGTLPGAVAAAAGQAEALVVVSLEPGGPGEGAGLQVGDALLAVDGQPVGGVRELLGRLVARGEGAELALTLWRAGARVEVPVTLAARPSPRVC